MWQAVWDESSMQDVYVWVDDVLVSPPAENAITFPTPAPTPLPAVAPAPAPTPLPAVNQPSWNPLTWTSPETTPAFLNPPAPSQDIVQGQMPPVAGTTIGGIVGKGIGWLGGKLGLPGLVTAGLAVGGSALVASQLANNGGSAPSGSVGNMEGTELGFTPQQGLFGLPIGVPEPPAGMVAKQWSVAVHSNTIGTFRIFYFRLLDGRTVMYNPATKGWKVWRDYKSIVIGKSLTTSNVKRVSKRLHSHVHALRKVLKIIK